ncbi:MAG: TIGR03986 family CRISPR-associated RAMP protein [Peptococcaceae bacterium]|nr:TIGR03986 family CRISPR-associated RAMP protein [Peptococcaceae bacterium]
MSAGNYGNRGGAGNYGNRGGAGNYGSRGGAGDRGGNGYRVTQERFINPYNFVSINDAVRRGPVERGALSGAIACELETLSPLFIPNTTRDKVFGDTYAHSYDFFSYADLRRVKDPGSHYARPIIPGSSLRGAIRGACEAALNGCMSTCDDENTLYRRSPVPRQGYGIIEKDTDTGERVLYRASKAKWPIARRAGHKTGETLVGGIYLRGDYGPNTKNDAIMKYAPDQNGDKVEVRRFGEESREWANFIEVWRLYQQRQGPIKGVNQLGPDKHSGYKGYLKAEKIPVYYTKLDNSDFYYLAPAAMTKEVFSRTLKELLEKQGGHNPCERLAEVCPVCALFGLAGEEALASRLMFRDGVPAADGGETDWSGWYDTVRVLPILSGPKVSATEFYMEDAAGASYFNYDYFVNYYNYKEYDKTGRLIPKTAAVRQSLENPRLRGRKFYWHRKSVVVDHTASYPKQRTEVRPIKAKKKFRFEIVFDRLTRDELESLLWLLTFGDANGINAHKIGYGKPYGYGSVRVTGAEVSLVTLNDDLSLTRAAAEFAPKMPAPTSPAGETSLREYLRLTDYAKASDEVRYPRGDKGGRNGGTIYDWFGINKEIRRGAFSPEFNYALPKPLDGEANLALPGYERGDGGKGGNRGDIKAAAAPEAQSSGIPLPAKAAAGGAGMGTIKEMREAKAGARDAAREAAKGFGKTAARAVYDRDKLKRALGNYQYNPQSRKLLTGFISDFEAAPEQYKDLKGTYESVKGRYKNG